MKFTHNKNSWIMLIPLSAFLLFDFIQLNMMGAMSPYLVKCLSLSPQKLGLLSSLFFYVDCALLIPAGIWLDCYSPQYLVIVSISITLLGIVIFILNPSWNTAMIWRSFSGVAGAFSYLSCIKIIASFFSENQRGVLIGATGMIIMLSGLIAQYPLDRLVLYYGLLPVLKMDILLGIFVNGIMLVFIKKKQPLLSHLTYVHTKNAYKKGSNWLLALYACLINFPLFVLAALWGNFYITITYHFSFSESTLITSMIFMGNMIGSPLLGFYSDRIKKRTKLMIIVSLLYFISLIALFYFSDLNKIILEILFFVLGFSTGGQTLAYATTIESNKSVDIAKAMSLLSLLTVAGGALAQFLFGYLTGGNYHFQKGIIFLIASAFISIFISIIIHYSYEKNREVIIT